ncbi:Decaprenyl diphosphate synthase-like protein [Gracilaria domingensis]|nr:Decaprenyl diphosphate synthase-like protein [Gracilaria domingensis]
MIAPCNRPNILRPGFLTMLLSKLMDCFYYLFYIFLKLLHTISKKAANANARFQILFEQCQGKLRTEKAVVETPNHVALSGAISNDMQAVWSNVQSLISRGTRHITLHDPNEKIDASEVERLVKESHIGLACKVIQIGSRYTLESVIRSVANSSVDKVSGLDGSIGIRTYTEVIGAELEIVITIVEGRSGVPLLTRAARTLAHSTDIETSLLCPESVTEWLDSNAARCMLPSEPDVVMVFPSSLSSWAPVLDGFPVWQLRLSQIVFASIPIKSLKLQELLRLVTKASSAPKRFGR